MQTVGVWGMDIESKAFQYPLKRLANDSIFLPPIEKQYNQEANGADGKKGLLLFRVYRQRY